MATGCPLASRISQGYSQGCSQGYSHGYSQGYSQVYVDGHRLPSGLTFTFYDSPAVARLKPGHGPLGGQQRLEVFGTGE